MLVTISQSDVVKLLLVVQPTVENPKDSSFTITNEKDKQKILTYKKLEPANVFLGKRLK